MDNQQDIQLETTILAGGCFWCLEAIFASLNGVRQVTSGYCGGHVPNPDYRSVCRGDTGHAEAVQVIFDPAVISLTTLLSVFFSLHDPTTRDRQGADIGTQYRSVIFTQSPAQQSIADAYIQQLTASGRFSAPIVTEVTPAGVFYPAETEHQRYYWQNQQTPYCQLVITPKIAALRQQHLPLFDD